MNQPELELRTALARFLLVPSNPDCCEEIPRCNPGDLSAPKKLNNKALVAYMLGSSSVEKTSEAGLSRMTLAQF